MKSLINQFYTTCKEANLELVVFSRIQNYSFSRSRSHKCYVFREYALCCSRGRKSSDPWHTPRTTQNILLESLPSKGQYNPFFCWRYETWNTLLSDVFHVSDCHDPCGIKDARLNLNIQTNDSRSAFHFACSNGNISLISLFLNSERLVGLCKQKNKFKSSNNSRI